MAKKMTKKNYNTIYVVNYKETTIDSDNVMETESGVCEVGYADEKDAIKKCWELTDEKINEFSDDFDEDLEKIIDGERDEDDSECYRETNKNGDWQCVYHYGDTFEYWVTQVIVDR